MSKKKVRLLLNSFEIQTRRSHKKAVSLSFGTIRKLSPVTVPALQQIHNDYLPHHEAYINLDTAVGMLEGTYKGKTNSFILLINNLPVKLRQWEAPIHTVFMEDSAEAIDIFSRKRTPFYVGTYEQRLMAIRVLRNKLAEYIAAYPALAPVQTDVATYCTLAETARSLQQGKEGNLGELRTLREAQRVATMNAYWGIVYCGLMRQFYTNPAEVAAFIEFELLYEKEKEEEEGDEGLTGAIV